MSRSLAWLILSLVLSLPASATDAISCAELRSATVTRVLDGDTFDATVEIWPGLRFDRRVRLLDYNAPESRGPEKAWGVQATAALRALLTVGAPVFLESRGDDAFGRVLAVVVLPDSPAETVAQRLVREGWGVRWDGRGARPVPWLSGLTYPIRPAQP